MGIKFTETAELKVDLVCDGCGRRMDASAACTAAEIRECLRAGDCGGWLGGWRAYDYSLWGPVEKNRHLVLDETEIVCCSEKCLPDAVRNVVKRDLGL